MVLTPFSKRIFSLIVFSQPVQCISGVVVNTTVLMSLAKQEAANVNAMNNTFVLILF